MIRTFCLVVFLTAMLSAQEPPKSSKEPAKTPVKKHRSFFHRRHRKPPSDASQASCKHGVEYVDRDTTGEIIEGPVCVQTTVNALRYSTTIKLTISETAGKDLSAQLKPPEPLKIQDTETLPGDQANHVNSSRELSQKAECTSGDIDKEFNCILKVVDSTDPVLAGFQRQVRNQKTEAQKQITVLKTIVEQSDEVLRGGAKKLIDNAQALTGSFTPIVWPPVEDTLDRINENIRRLNALHQLDKWPDWYKGHSKEYDNAFQRANAQKSSAEAIAPSSDTYNTVSRQFAQIQNWKTLIQSLVPAMFLSERDVPCGALFNVTRNNTLKLSQIDRLPTLDLKDPATIITDNWVAVRCSNPFTVSAGTTFSFVSDSEFGVVASKGSPDASGNPTAVNKFQTTSTSDVPKLPIALVHARLWDLDSDKVFGFHASFGVAAHTRSAAQGGSNPEYLLGASVSLLRTFFITGGPYWATRVKLAGGFSPGDQVPTGVSSAPIRKDGVRGWAIAVSFTKP